MGWVSLRVVLAYVLPGFLPITAVAYFYGFDFLDPRRTGSSLEVSAFLLAGVLAGLFIDSFRHRAHKALVKFRAAAFISRIVLLPISLLTGGLISCSRDWPQAAYEHYSEHEKRLIRLWMKLKYAQSSSLSSSNAGKDVTEYFDELVERGTIGFSEIWALLALMGHEKLRFFADEHFSYYEFAMNLYCALWFTFAYGLVVGALHHTEFSAVWWLLWIVGHLVALGLVYDMAMFWLLVSKRFFRKLLEFDLLNCE